MYRVLLGIFLAATGIFSILAAFCNWGFFMNSRGSRFFVKIMGRTRARICYLILGHVIMVLGMIIFNAAR